MIRKPRRNVIIPTEFGMMMVNRFDYNDKENFAGVGHHLLRTGSENLESVFIFGKYLANKLCPVVVDVGANIGTFTVQLSYITQVLNGTVHAFEPQRQVFQMLNGNIAMNSIDNVYTNQAAVGEFAGTITVPKINYYQPGSFGSVGLSGDYNDVGQDLDFSNGENVPKVALDTYFKHYDNVDAIKIDVEGMEMEVIAGAVDIIKKHRPLLYIEYNKQPNGGNDLVAYIKALAYDIFVIDINILCVPSESIDLPEYNFIKEMQHDGS
jgi:FkbM family methyltransferase